MPSRPKTRPQNESSAPTRTKPASGSKRAATKPATKTAPRGNPDRHVALLRAVNVGGNNKLPMKALTALVEKLGATRVETYIQSGNVAYDAAGPLAERMAQSLSDAIKTAHGFSVPVVTRSAAELARIARAHPFAAPGIDDSRLFVVFLGSAPSKAAMTELSAFRGATEELVARGRELYLHFPAGIAKTKLTNERFDRLLDTTSTVRNWRTVNKLVEMTRGE